MRTCDNCKRDPIQFKPDDQDPEAPICWWMLIPRVDHDPAILMSNGEFCFGMCLDRDPPNDTEHEFWCINCFDAAFGNADENE